MRLSTAAIHRTSIDAILQQQTRLARTQTQVTSGKRFQSSSEDPIAATRAAALDRTVADNAQFDRNSNIIESRLSYEEQSLADMTLLLQQSRDLALQGANSTLGQGERNMLVTELKQLRGELLDVANRDDGNGEYLFAGTSTGTRPFAQGTTGVNYVGDQTTRFIRVSGSQAIADGHPGTEVFMNLTQANGTFRTAVAAANTGSATIDMGTVVDPAAWVRDNYTLRFTSATDWVIEDDTVPTPVQVASGAGFASGQAISFLGTRVTLTGTPATGDKFTIQPSQDTDIFSVLDNLIGTLDGGAGLPSDKAIFQQQIGASIADLDQGLNRVLSVRAEVGTRLSAIDQATSTRESEAIDLQQLLSDLRDVDYASAISQLNQQYAGLQAAQQAYTKISQLSLFDYL
ncbi:MAG TPA: flagellar hook-associated protein FlgL [Steroidobacteraceae bacterium]|nr:flagellar hook-associated protein FlgL [Steroidobacteraceae bacterium]